MVCPESIIGYCSHTLHTLCVNFSMDACSPSPSYSLCNIGILELTVVYIAELEILADLVSKCCKLHYIINAILKSVHVTQLGR